MSKLVKRLPQLIRAFCGELERRGRSDKYVASTRHRLSTMSSALATLRLERLEEFLDRLMATGLGRRSGATASTRTRDEYGRTAKQFGRWLVRRGHVKANPFEILENIHVRGRDETYIRRAVSLSEVHRLAGAAPDRAVLYWLAVTTGLRAGELRHLRWSDLNLNDRLVLHLPGYREGKRVTKNGKDAVLPLQPWVSGMLLLKAGFGCWTDTVVFDMPKDTAGMIRADAERAGVSLMDRQGRVLDFHSLRCGTLQILIDLGVEITAIRELMRHAKIQTTLDHYHKADVGRLAASFSIPDPRSA